MQPEHVAVAVAEVDQWHQRNEKLLHGVETRGYFGLFSLQFDTVRGINGWNGVDDKKNPASGT